MGATSVAGANAPARPYWEDDARRWLIGGVTALFVLIGVAVLMSVLVPVVRGNMPMFPFTTESWTWVFQLLGIVLAIWLVVWIVRVITVSAVGPIDARYYRHAFRHYYRDWAVGYDPALTAARERYARGEISRDQFAQIARDLGHPQNLP